MAVATDRRCSLLRSCFAKSGVISLGSVHFEIEIIVKRFMLVLGVASHLLTIEAIDGN